MVTIASRVTGLEDAMEAVGGRAEKQQQRVLQAAVIRWKHRLLCSVFEGWARVTRIQRRLHRLVRRWQHGILLEVFEGWAEVVWAQHALLKRVAQRWVRQCVAAAWRRWLEMVEEARAQRAALARAVGRMQNRLAAQMFAAWREAVELAREQYARAQKVAIRLQHRETVRAFQAWREAWRSASEVRMGIARKVVAGMQQRLVVEAFESWLEVVRVANEQRLAARRLLGRWLARQLAEAFAGWDAAIKKAKWNRQVVARVFGRIQNRTAASAFAAWLELAQELAEGRAQLTERCAQLLSSRAQEAAFDRWYSQAEHQKAVFARARQLAGRMMHALVGRCFDGWVAYIDNKLQVFRRAAHAIGPKRLLALTFRTWSHVVKELTSKRNHEVLLGSVDARMTDNIGRMEAIFERRVAAQINAHLENKLSEIGGMAAKVIALESSVKGLPSAADVHRQVADAVRTAEEKVAEAVREAAAAEAQRRADEAERQQREEERAREQLMRRVYLRWCHKMASAIFDAWAVLAWKNVMLAKDAFKRAALAWRSAAMVKCWRRWGESARKRSRFMQLLRRSVGRIRATLLFIAFEAWADEMRECIEVRRIENAERLAREAEALRVREEAAKEQRILSELRMVGVKWFDEMRSEMHMQSEQQAEVQVNASLKQHAELQRSHESMQESFLAMLDKRYLPHGHLGLPRTQFDRDVVKLQQNLVEHVARLNDESTYLKSLLRSMIKDPGAIEKLREGASTRTLRPLRLPPHFSSYADAQESSESIIEMASGAGAPVRWLRTSRSMPGTMHARHPMHADDHECISDSQQQVKPRKDRVKDAVWTLQPPPPLNV
jgi:hypothetical protein